MNMTNDNVLAGTNPAGTSPTEAQGDRFDRVKTFLNDHIANSRDDSTVDVIPLQCGLGKSRYTTIEIHKALSQRQGAFIVTDEVVRLKRYFDGDGEDSQLREYIRKNKDDIVILTAENARDDYDDLFTKRVVAITTQRFFAMERDDILAIVNSHKPKRTLIIDERAPLSKMVRINVKVLNDIDTALNMNLDNRCREKDFLTSTWRDIREIFLKIFAEMEHSHKAGKKEEWVQPQEPRDIDSDGKFIDLISKTYKRELQKPIPNGNSKQPQDAKSNLEIILQIKAAMQVLNDGGLIVSSKKSSRKPKQKSDQTEELTDKGEYNNYFLVDLDFRELVTNLGCKTIVLDGTGDIDPIYDLWYVNHVDVHAFNRPLNNLTINLVDVNTSKVKLTETDRNKQLTPEAMKLISAIRQYIHRASIEPIDAIFTYQAIEPQFREDAKLTGYFGRIKGSNKYRDCTNIIQIGLNREPDENYLCRAMHNRTKRYGVKFISVFDAATAQTRTMLKSLLADTEQNLFRSAIRNAGDDRPVTYTILCNCKQQAKNPLAGFVDMVRERYEPYGATVNTIRTPSEITPTQASKVCEWLEAQPSGKQFTLAELREATGLTKDELKKVRHRNPDIEELLASMKTNITNVYKKPS